MNCGKNWDIGKLLIVLVLLLVLIYVLYSIGCAYGEDEYIVHDTRVKRPHNVNEKVFPIYNKKHLSIGEFLIVAGNDIKMKQQYHGWKIYKVRVEMARNLERGYEITAIWFYHD